MQDYFPAVLANPGGVPGIRYCPAFENSRSDLRWKTACSAGTLQGIQMDSSGKTACKKIGNPVKQRFHSDVVR